MAKKKLENNIANEIAVLKQKFDSIKADTEEFIASAKALSDKGVEETKELLEAAKDNWHSIVSSFEDSKLAKFFSKTKAKKVTKKKAAAKVKKVAKKVASKKKK